MGRGSDTRMYSPRSESNTMYSSANEDGDKYSPTSPEDADKRRENKQIKEEERRTKLKDIKHIKIKPSQGLGSGPSLPTEEGLDDGNKRDDEREIGLQGGPAGSRGHLLDMATGAKTGTGSAMGTGNSAVRTGEPMDGAWSTLLKEDDYSYNDKQRAILEMVLNSTYNEAFADDLRNAGINHIDQIYDAVKQPDGINILNALIQQHMPEAQPFSQNLEKPSLFDQDFQSINTSEPMDGAWSELLKRDTHPGSLAAYRQMVENLGDDLPMEQRMAQQLGEKLSPEQLRMRPPSVHTIQDGQFTDNVEHLPDIPILNEKDELHAEGTKNQDEFLDMFSKPSIRNENVGGPPAALDSFVDAMRNEKVDLMREYDDVPDELIQDAKEIDEPVFADDIHDYLDESDYENVPYYAGLQGKPMRRTYTPNMMEREEMPTFAGTPFNEDTNFTMSEPMEDAWSSLLKRETPKSIQARRRREARQQFRPSTGQFKKPPGGQSGGAGATMRRFKARMRGIKGGRKTGLMKPHLSVEMSHRGIATKQPMSKDPQKYRQYMGQQEAQKILGGIRNTFSPHARHSARSFQAGPTGGGRLTGMLPGQAGQMRQPSLTRLRRPRMPRIRPVMPPAPPMPPQVAPPMSSVPSMPAPSSTMMMSEERTQSDILKTNRYANRTEMLELMRRLIAASRKRNKLMKYVQGGGSAFEDGHVPTHPAGVHQHEDEEEKNDGPTQNLETNSSRLGLDPAGHLSGKRGHFG